MIETTEDLDTQTEIQEDALTPEEIADLKAKASISSQNFERAKRAEADKKALEEKVALLESQVSGNDFGVDQQVAQQIASLTAKLNAIEEQKQLDSVFATYPALADKKVEFDTFRQDYPNVPLASVAKVFLTDNDMLEAPRRKGLEKAGGGRRVAPSNGKMTAEEAKALRTGNQKVYLQMLREGKIQL